MTTFRNPLADPLGTRRGPPLVRGPQFEKRWATAIIIIDPCRTSVSDRIRVMLCTWQRNARNAADVADATDTTQ